MEQTPDMIHWQTRATKILRTKKCKTKRDESTNSRLFEHIIMSKERSFETSAKQHKQNHHKIWRKLVSTQYVMGTTNHRHKSRDWILISDKTTTQAPSRATNTTTRSITAQQQPKTRFHRRAGNTNTKARKLKQWWKNADNYDKRRHTNKNGWKTDKERRLPDMHTDHKQTKAELPEYNQLLSAQKLNQAISLFTTRLTQRHVLSWRRHNTNDYGQKAMNNTQPFHYRHANKQNRVFSRWTDSTGLNEERNVSEPCNKNTNRKHWGRNTRARVITADRVTL